jgi:hypothetical protein
MSYLAARAFVLNLRWTKTNARGEDIPFDYARRSLNGA